MRIKLIYVDIQIAKFSNAMFKFEEIILYIASNTIFTTRTPHKKKTQSQPLNEHHYFKVGDTNHDLSSSHT